MGRRKIEMYEFRNVLIRLRAGDRDREFFIAVKGVSVAPAHSD